jgi:hypothetical protein
VRQILKHFKNIFRFKFQTQHKTRLNLSKHE